MSENLWHVHDDGFTGTHIHRVGAFKVEHTHVDDPKMHVVEIDKGDGTRWRHKQPGTAPVIPPDVSAIVDIYDGEDDELDVPANPSAGDDGTLDVQSTQVRSRGLFRRRG